MGEIIEVLGRVYMVVIMNSRPIASIVVNTTHSNVNWYSTIRLISVSS